jgi:hypothetical protein
MAQDERSEIMTGGRYLPNDPESDAMRGALPIEKFLMTVVVITLVVGCSFLAYNYGRHEARSVAKREAVAAGAARWDSGEQGEPVFAWRTCTAPMGVMK